MDVSTFEVNLRVVGERYLILEDEGILLSKKRGQKVVINLPTSHLVHEIAGKYGAKIYEVDVGETNVVAKMEKLGSMVGKGSSIMSEYTTVYYPQGPTTYPPKLDIKTGLGEIGGTSFGGDIGVVVKF